MEVKADISLLEKTIFTNNNISHAFLIEVDESYNTDLSKLIVKNIISNAIDDNQKLQEIYTLIDNDNFSEMKIIKPEGKNIKKEQLTQMMSELKSKPIHSNNLFYIIEYAENLNVYSANTILKFLEEPEDGIIAILITKNIYGVLPTITSRCQYINLNKYTKKQYDTEIVNQAFDFLFCLCEKKERAIAYLSDFYSLSQDLLKQILDVATIICYEAINYDILKLESDDYIDSEKAKKLSLCSDIQNLYKIQENLSKAIMLLNYNVNTRVILDLIVIGGM